MYLFYGMDRSVCLTPHTSKNIWVVSTLGLFWNYWKYLCLGFCVATSLNKCLETQLLCHVLHPCSIFSENCTILHSYQLGVVSQLLCIHTSICLCYDFFKILVVMTGIMWCLIVVLICISFTFFLWFICNNFSALFPYQEFSGWLC